MNIHLVLFFVLDVLKDIKTWHITAKTFVSRVGVYAKVCRSGRAPLENYLRLHCKPVLAN